MKKDKEWLNGWFNTGKSKQLYAEDYIKSKIDQLEEITNPTLSKKETVEVPQFIADYLEIAKQDITLMRVFELANTRREYVKWKKQYDWIEINYEKFARAWLDGYTIEPEKKVRIAVGKLDGTYFRTEIPEDEAKKLIEGWKEDE